MEDFLSKKIFKVMSVLSQPEIIWDMKSEHEIPITESVYLSLEQFIDIDKWIKSYYFYYKKWIQDDCNYIYDISSSINKDIIQAIIEYNKLNECKLFFWFDVDRNINEQFEWELCPLSKTKLRSLGEEVHPNNRLISLAYPLVFPQTT